MRGIMLKRLHNIHSRILNSDESAKENARNNDKNDRNAEKVERRLSILSSIKDLRKQVRCTYINT